MKQEAKDIPTYDLASTAANADWVRAGRLKERADAGDKEAARELEELQNAQLYEPED